MTVPDAQGWAASRSGTLVNVRTGETRTTVYDPNHAYHVSYGPGPRYAYILRDQGMDSIVDISLQGTRIENLPGTDWYLRGFDDDVFGLELGGYAPIWRYDRGTGELATVVPEGVSQDLLDDEGARPYYGRRATWAGGGAPPVTEAGWMLVRALGDGPAWSVDLESGRLTDYRSREDRPTGTELSAFQGETWALVVSAGVPYWRIERASGRVERVELTLGAGEHFETQVTADFALVTADGLPTARIDLRTGTTMPLSRAGLRRGTGFWAQDGRVAAVDAAGPVWEADLPSGMLRSFELPIPREVDSLPHEVSAAPGPDGRLTVWYLDGAALRLYATGNDRAGWTPLGLPVREFNTWGFSRMTHGWLISSCGVCYGELRASDPLPPDSGPVLSGSTVQVVLDDGTLLFAGNENFPVQLQASNACALVEIDGVQTLLDLAARERRPLGTFEALRFMRRGDTL